MFMLTCHRTYFEANLSPETGYLFFGPGLNVIQCGCEEAHGCTLCTDGFQAYLQTNNMMVRLHTPHAHLYLLKRYGKI